MGVQNVQEGYCLPDLDEAADGIRPTSRVRDCSIVNCQWGPASAGASRRYGVGSAKDLVKDMNAQTPPARFAVPGCMRRP